jgi:hypothetical protein
MFKHKTGPLFSLSEKEIKRIQEFPKPKNSHYVIAGYVNFTWCSVVAFRADGLMLVIPFVMLNDNPMKTASPNFEDFSIIDGGLTLKFGSYEVAVNYILYDLDAEYRIWSDNNRLN